MPPQECISVPNRPPENGLERVLGGAVSFGQGENSPYLTLKSSGYVWGKLKKKWKIDRGLGWEGVCERGLSVS